MLSRTRMERKCRASPLLSPPKKAASGDPSIWHSDWVLEILQDSREVVAVGGVIARVLLVRPSVPVVLLQASIALQERPVTTTLHLLTDITILTSTTIHMVITVVEVMEVVGLLPDRVAGGSSGPTLSRSRCL
jgi:hypothetical protein